LQLTFDWNTFSQDNEADGPSRFLKAPGIPHVSRGDMVRTARSSHTAYCPSVSHTEQLNNILFIMRIRIHVVCNM
jgi:hypothetical protein